MITFFHNFANTWGAKLIFGLLAVCMIIWFGVGSFSDSNPLVKDAVKVGSKTVSIQELNRQFEIERKKLSGLMGGKYVSPKQALQSGLLVRLVQGQVNELLHEQIKDELGLGASNAAVQKYVERNPVFADVLGQFDRNLFYAYLTQNQMTEAQMAEALKKELSNQHLTNTLMKIGYAPDTLATLIYRAQNDTKDVTALFVATDKIPVAQQPTEEMLREYYESEAEKLMLPEYRSLNIVLITPELMADRVTVDAGDVDAVYDSQKDKFNTPEKRQVYQMRFENKADADRLLKEITPKTFEQVAIDKVGQTKEQTEFGFVAQNELLSELAEPVFAAAVNQIVGPVESDTGWHILWVRAIQAADIKPMSALKKQIKQQLALEKAYDGMYDTVRQLEDVLGTGVSLTEAAKTLKLPLTTVNRVDISGQKSDGTSMPVSLNNAELLQNVFTLKKGDVSSVVEQKNGFIVAEVTDVVPVAQKAFKDAKADMKKLWIADQQKNKLDETVQSIIQAAQKGDMLETQGAFRNFDRVTDKSFSIKTNTKQFPTEVVRVLQHQPVGNQHVAQVALPDGVWVFVTNKIKPVSVDKNSAAYKLTQAELKTQTGQELVHDTLVGYAQKLGVVVNEKEIEKAFSVYNTEE